MNFLGQQGDGLSIILFMWYILTVYYGLRVARNLQKRWTSFQHEPLMAWQKDLLDRAAFFLGVPIGVVIHELGHALVVWAFGGQIVDFGYGLYWGYVVSAGPFTPAQNWFISLAGTLGSLLYGFAIWWIFRRKAISSYQFFGLRVLRVHLIYSLIFYPIFTFLTVIGDWRVIYDFKSTPFLSAVTLFVHIVSLALLWWVDRRGMFEMPAFRSESDLLAYKELREKAFANPNNVQLQLELLDNFRRSDMYHTADYYTKRFLNENPDEAVAYLLQALNALGGKEKVSKRSYDYAVKALEVGLGIPVQIAQASMLAGSYALGVDRLQEAQTHLTRGIDAVEGSDIDGLSAELYYLRARARRRSRNFQEALVDINRAINLAQASNNEQVADRYYSEQKIIAEQVGSRVSRPRSSDFNK